MARITIEDCIQRVPNRFALVLLAAQRSRELANGAIARVSKEGDKNTVISLREIADTDISLEDLESQLVLNLQRFRDRDEPDEMDDEAAFTEQFLASGELDNSLDEKGLPAAHIEAEEESGALDAEIEALNDAFGADLDAEMDADGDENMSDIEGLSPEDLMEGESETGGGFEDFPSFEDVEKDD